MNSKILQEAVLHRMSNTWTTILNNISPDTPPEKITEAVQAYYILKAFILNHVKRESSDD